MKNVFLIAAIMLPATATAADVPRFTYNCTVVVECLRDKCNGPFSKAYNKPFDRQNVYGRPYAQAESIVTGPNGEDSGYRFESYAEVFKMPETSKFKFRIESWVKLTQVTDDGSLTTQFFGEHRLKGRIHKPDHDWYEAFAERSDGEDISFECATLEVKPTPSREEQK